MLDAHRNIFKEIEGKIGKFFSQFPLTPNQYTISSVIFALVGFCFILKVNIILAVLFFIISSFLDFIDGAVARYKNLDTKFGSYLDTIADRFVEGILLLGILFLPLPDVILKSYIWIFLILFGSLMTTYSKAAAKEKDLVVEELKGGLLARGERMILIISALFLGLFSFYWTVCLLIVVAVLSNITVFQRIYFAIKKNKKQN